jgi:hypothetical protein
LLKIIFVGVCVGSNMFVSRQKRIVCLFKSDGGFGAVSAVNRGVVGQNEQFAFDVSG